MHRLAKAFGHSTILLGVLAAAGCGGGDKGSNAPQLLTLAPLCSEVGGGPQQTELFTAAVVPTDKVEESLIFGGMDPGGLEPINHELGFLLTELNVPVSSPGTLDIRTMEYTTYLTGSRAGETDYAFSFHVCSEEVDGVRVPAVEGHFAHMTGLSPAFLELLENKDFTCNTYAGNPEETVETCTYMFPYDEEDGLIVTAGTPMGFAGGTGLTAYAPGFDFNLTDTRTPNQFINPDRIASETGAGRGFRYGACVYEYFDEPFRAGYMGKVGQGGDLRVHDDLPCGTVEIDLAGTAAGIWIREEAAGLTIDSDDWMEVISNVLVLGPHPVFPGQREVVSSYLTEVATDGLLVEFIQTNVGDVNRSVYEMTPGTTHCLSGTGFGNPVAHHYLIEVGVGGDTLTLERIAQSCELSPELERIFTAAAITFVR